MTDKVIAFDVTANTNTETKEVATVANVETTTTEAAANTENKNTAVPVAVA